MPGTILKVLAGNVDILKKNTQIKCPGGMSFNENVLISYTTKKTHFWYSETRDPKFYCDQKYFYFWVILLS